MFTSAYLAQEGKREAKNEIGMGRNGAEWRGMKHFTNVTILFNANIPYGLHTIE